MLLHNGVHIAVLIGTSIAGVRILTWLTALYGSERLSKRAMWLLDRGRSVLDPRPRSVIPRQPAQLAQPRMLVTEGRFRRLRQALTDEQTSAEHGEVEDDDDPLFIPVGDWLAG